MRYISETIWMIRLYWHTLWHLDHNWFYENGHTWCACGYGCKEKRQPMTLRKSNEDNCQEYVIPQTERAEMVDKHYQPTTEMGRELKRTMIAMCNKSGEISG